MIMILALHMATAHVTLLCVCVFVCLYIQFVCVWWGSTKGNRVHSLGSKATETFKNMVVHFLANWLYLCVCVCLCGSVVCRLLVKCLG